MESERDLEIRIAVLESQNVWLKESIKYQAVEYERRLTELNHAHAQSIVDKAKFLDKDLFYSKYDDFAKWRGEIDQWKARVVGIAVGAGAVSGGVMGFIFQLFRK